MGNFKSGLQDLEQILVQINFHLMKQPISTRNKANTTTNKAESLVIEWMKPCFLLI